MTQLSKGRCKYSTVENPEARILAPLYAYGSIVFWTKYETWHSNMCDPQWRDSWWGIGCVNKKEPTQKVFKNTSRNVDYCSYEWMKYALFQIPDQNQGSHPDDGISGRKSEKWGVLVNEACMVSEVSGSLGGSLWETVTINEAWVGYHIVRYGVRCFDVDE